MVTTVKHDEEVSIEYMHAKEREDYFIRQGIQQGRKEAEDEIRKLKEEIVALKKAIDAQHPQPKIMDNSQHL